MKSIAKPVAIEADMTNDFEQWPPDQPKDETDIALRAYVSRLSAEHLAKFDPTWTDEQVRAWDGNFRSDGALMLVCCERDVDVREFRGVVESFLAFRRGDSPASARDKSGILDKMT